MSDNLQIQDTPLRRSAYVYIRQSSATQVLVNRESTQRQYQLTERAAQLGWSKTQIKVIDEDLAHTGSAWKPRALPATMSSGLRMVKAAVNATSMKPDASANECGFCPRSNGRC